MKATDHYREGARLLAESQAPLPGSATGESAAALRGIQALAHFLAAWVVLTAPGPACDSAEWQHAERFDPYQGA